MPVSRRCVPWTRPGARPPASIPSGPSVARCGLDRLGPGSSPATATPRSRSPDLPRRDHPPAGLVLHRSLRREGRRSRRSGRHRARRRPNLEGGSRLAPVRGEKGRCRPRDSGRLSPAIGVQVEKRDGKSFGDRLPCASRAKQALPDLPTEISPASVRFLPGPTESQSSRRVQIGSEFVSRVRSPSWRARGSSRGDERESTGPSRPSLRTSRGRRREGERRGQALGLLCDKRIEHGPTEVFSLPSGHGVRVREEDLRWQPSLEHDGRRSA